MSLCVITAMKTFGLLTGVAGAHYTAASSERSRWWGFASWLMGDIAFVISWMMTGDLFMIALFSFYTYTAYRGLKNNSTSEEEK